MTLSPNLAPWVLEVDQAAALPANTLILDCSSQAQYESGHWPGALWLPPQFLLCGTAPVPGKPPHVNELNRLFDCLGLHSQRPVLVMDDEGGGWAGRLLWTLDLLGHAPVYYLNGGIRACLSAGVKLEQVINQPQAISPQHRQLHPQCRIELPQLLREYTDSQIWDARSLAEYQGSVRASLYGGHIPGARHLEWSDLYDPARGYRIRTDALARIVDAGLDPARPIITHCQSHHRSGFSYLVGKALGLNIAAYDGGWSEWGNQADTPKSTGTDS
jgi:thiosulfate/3-mercaptopyruvate sulfurtransferase